MIGWNFYRHDTIIEVYDYPIWGSSLRDSKCELGMGDIIDSEGIGVGLEVRADVKKEKSDF
jgi:hypothetical protein